MPTAKTKIAWDTRNWFLSLLLGNLAGFLLFCGDYPSLHWFLEGAFPYSAFGYYADDFVRLLGFVCGGLVFPAVLTLTAKRHYSLWGLLPLGLLVIWIVAGDLVSLSSRLSLRDNPLPLFGYFLALLCGAGMCWLIASLPIALSRPAWQHRREALGASASGNPKIKQIGTVVLLAPVIILVLLGWYNFKHPPIRHFQMEVHWASSNEARVPLVVKHGGIFVMASLNGEPHLCKVDTGSDTVQWAKSSRLTGSFTGEYGQVNDAMKKSVDTDTVRIPYMQIGSYKITNLPTERLDINSILLPISPDTDILLGNPAFDLTVLTIDYQNKMMIIRPPSYDFQKVPRHQRDQIVQLGWTYHQDDTPAEQQVFGWPAVRASVDGKPFWCMLDTGWEGPELGLSENFANRVPALEKLTRKKVSFSGGYINSTAIEVPLLKFQVPCRSPTYVPTIVLQGKGLFVSSLGGGQGIVGTYLMERYRITIDYQRHLVLLEPYARDVPGQEQEKR